LTAPCARTRPSTAPNWRDHTSSCLFAYLVRVRVRVWARVRARVRVRVSGGGSSGPGVPAATDLAMPLEADRAEVD